MGIDIKKIENHVDEYLKQRKIKLDHAIFDKIIQVVLSEDISAKELVPHKHIIDGDTITMPYGFEVLYEPYRGKNKLEKELSEIKCKINHLKESLNSILEELDD